VIAGVVPVEIREGPAAIRATLTSSRDAAEAAADALRRGGVRRVFVIGNGTSYHSALAAAGLYARGAGPDDPVAIAMTAGAFRTYPPALGRGDAVVGISASGEFADVVATVEALRGRTPTVGIVHVAESSLARVADHVVRSAGGASNVPVMTKTFSATLVATELVLIGLLGASRLAHASAAIARAGWSASDRVYFASGEKFSDALSGVPAAAHADAPLLLIRPSCTPSPVFGVAESLDPTEKLLLGGPLTVSEDALEVECRTT